MLIATLYRFYCEELNLVIGLMTILKYMTIFIHDIFLTREILSHKYLVAIHVHV